MDTLLWAEGREGWTAIKEIEDLHGLVNRFEAGGAGAYVLTLAGSLKELACDCLGFYALFCTALTVFLDVQKSSRRQRQQLLQLKVFQMLMHLQRMMSWLHSKLKSLRSKLMSR